MFAMLDALSHKRVPLRLGIVSALLVGGIGVVAVYQPEAAIAMACVPVAVWLVESAKRPVLPWLAITGIVAAGTTLPGHIPLGDVACTLALVLCTADHVDWPTDLPRQLTGLLTLVFAAAALSVLVDQPPLTGAGKRLFHLAIYALLIGAVAMGRIRVHNLVRGIRVGIVLGLLTGLAGMAGVGRFDTYPGRLTGIFGDPNVASLVTVGLGMVVLHYSTTPRERWSIVALMVVIVGLTLSRTGILALVLALVWYLWVNRMPRSVALALVVGATVAALELPSTLQRFGPYSINSSGETSFRTIVNQLDAHAAAQHFLTGTGAGTATIVLPSGATFFFANSYEALLAEFGLPMAAVMLALMVFTAVSLWRCRPRAVGIEAGLLAVLISALTIGEVLFTLTAALVIGAAWRHILLTRRHDRAVPSSMAAPDVVAAGVPVLPG